MKFKDRSLKYFNTLVSESYEATYAVAFFPVLGETVRTCLISSPTWGIPVTVSNLIACNEEYVLSVYVTDVPTFVGFLTTPTCENLVSIGKSFVESSNLA